MAINPNIPLQANASVMPGISALSSGIESALQAGIQQAEAADRKRLRDVRITQINNQIAQQDRLEFMLDYAQDVLTMRTLLDGGDLAGANQLAQKRLKEDPDDNASVKGFADMLAKDPQQARRMLDSEVNNLIQLRWIGATPGQTGAASLQANAPVVLVNPETDEKKLVFPTIDKKTGKAKFENIEAEAGFVISLETPAEKRAAEVLADLEKTQNKLKEQLEKQPTIKAEEQLALDAARKAETLFQSVDKLGTSIANLQEARQALVDGANTGPIVSMWPSFTEASIRLENAQKRAGLDVVGATTFGALSKGELDLSLETALPTTLSPPELIKWIDRRVAAEQAKADYYQRQAIFLSGKGPDGKQNTRADWEKAEKAALQAALDAGKVTEDDIKETMRVNKMDRSAVLREIRRRFESGGT